VARPGHFYSAAIKSLPRLIGYSCSITTKASLLPCEPTATFDAFCAIWTGVTKADVSKWCQIGFTRRRYSGSTTVNFWIKVEVKAGPAAADYYYHTHAAPAVGSTHKYHGELNPSSGRWDVYMDDVWIDGFTNRGWISDSGDRVDYTGEVYDENAQMSGTSADRCVFSNCQYKVAPPASASSSSRSSSAAPSPPFVNAALTNANLTNSDASKWGNRLISGTSFEIWDKRH
jgi:hypothetical protein